MYFPQCSYFDQFVRKCGECGQSVTGIYLTETSTISSCASSHEELQAYEKLYPKMRHLVEHYSKPGIKLKGDRE